MCVTFSAPYIHDTIYTRIGSHSFASWIFKSSPSSAKICSCLPNTSNALRHKFIKVLEMFHGDFAPRPFDKADQFLQIFLWAVRFFLCCRYPVPARPEGAPLSRVQAAGKNTSSCHVSGAILRRRFITRPRGDAPGEEQSYLCNRHSETLLLANNPITTSSTFVRMPSYDNTISTWQEKLQFAALNDTSCSKIRQFGV